VREVHVGENIFGVIVWNIIAFLCNGIILLLKYLTDKTLASVNNSFAYTLNRTHP